MGDKFEYLVNYNKKNEYNFFLSILIIFLYFSKFMTKGENYRAWKTRLE